MERGRFQREFFSPLAGTHDTPRTVSPNDIPKRMAGYPGANQNHRLPGRYKGQILFQMLTGIVTCENEQPLAVVQPGSPLPCGLPNVGRAQHGPRIVYGQNTVEWLIVAKQRDQTVIPPSTPIT